MFESKIFKARQKSLKFFILKNFRLYGIMNSCCYVASYIVLATGIVTLTSPFQSVIFIVISMVCTCA